MSWQPNGRYYSFNPDVICSCVPEASGVYGLFNFRRQLYIGESENIQAALLRHLVDRSVPGRRYRASRFSFQLCSADERKRKAAELIEQFRPVRQGEAALTETTPPAVAGARSELPAGELDHERIDLEEFSMHEREVLPTARPRYYFERAQGAALIMLFAVCMVVSFYLGILTGEKLQREANHESTGAMALTPAAPLSANSVGVDLNEQSPAGAEAAGDVSVNIPGWTPKGGEPSTSTEAFAKTPVAPPSSDSTNSTGVQQAGTAVAGKLSLVPAAGNGDTHGKWSVQIAAAPARDVADALAERLTSAGHESYVVQAEVRGQTFFRVRVGPLEGQDQAESVRRDLARDERYRDAFLVNE